MTGLKADPAVKPKLLRITGMVIEILKILFISGGYPNERQPQYCIFIEQQALALKALGCDIDILVPSQRKEAEKNSLGAEPEVFHGLKIYQLHYTVKQYWKLHYVKTSDFTGALRRLLQRNNYDIVSIHCLMTDIVLKMCLRSCQVCDRKAVVHFHGLNVWKDYYHPHPYLQKYQAFRRKRILYSADCLIGVSNKVCDVIRERIRHPLIFTIYNGVDTNKFIPVDPIVSKASFRVICIANLIPTKGQEFLIEACLRLHREGVPVELALIGRGSEERRLKEKVASSKAGEFIQFYGYIGYEEIVKELEKSDVFVMPSYYEALGCVYLEAMAMKLPVIGIKGQGIEEILQDTQNGFLAEPQSSESIYEKLQWICDNREKASQIGILGYQTVTGAFTWLDSAESLLNVYNIVLNTKVK